MRMLPGRHPLPPSHTNDTNGVPGTHDEAVEDYLWFVHGEIRPGRELGQTLLQADICYSFQYYTLHYLKTCNR